MAVSAAQVKELREKTGLPMMECKKALVETDGDLDAAIKLLREKAGAKVDKKADRIAAEGVVALATAGGKAALVEVNSETDFVGQNEEFVAFAQEIADAVLASGTTDVAELAGVALASGPSVEERRTALVHKLGENMSVRRAQIVAASGPIAVYSHGGKIGSCIALEGGDEELAKKIAMHVAASAPQFISEADVDPAVVEAEKEIQIAKAQNEGKRKEIAEKMVVGRMRKFVAEITLYGQEFVMDPDLTVEKLVKNAGASVTSMVRFEVGEGIEKKEENFAEEVMAQVRG